MYKRIEEYSKCVLDYNRLERITQVEKPYRGTEDKYNLEERRYSHKSFTPETINGERVFRISYYHSYEKVMVTKEVYDAMPKSEQNRVYIQNYASGATYTTHTKKPLEIGIMYPDNSFEFTAEGEYAYTQGIKTAFSSHYLPASRLGSDSKRGGLRVSNNDFAHPVFKGLRVYVNTLELHELCSYETVGYKTNIKEVRARFAPYKESFVVADVMIKNMKFSDIGELIREEIPTEALGSYGDLLKTFSYRDIYNNAVSNLITNPLTSTLAIATLINTNAIRTRLRYTSVGSADFAPVLENLVEKVIKRFKTELCRTNTGTLLKKVIHPSSKKLPTSIWDYEVMVTGIEALRYK